MFCPQCGLERISAETNYCSRCGFLLTATTELLQTGGVPQLAALQPAAGAISPRKRGLKQGLFIFLLTFLVAPIVGMISVALRVDPIGVGIASVLFFMGGLLRMVYAMLFESTVPDGPQLETQYTAAPIRMAGRTGIPALPPQTEIPASQYMAPATGTWRDTNDLQPASVTEKTTQLLDREAGDQ